MSIASGPSKNKNKKGKSKSRVKGRYHICIQELFYTSKDTKIGKKVSGEHISKMTVTYFCLLPKI